MSFTHRTLTLLSLVVLLFAGAAWAQRGNAAIQVEVPFAFEVGNHVLPAGTYTIDRESPSILVIHNAQKRVVATVVAASAEKLAPPLASKLEFHIQQGRYILAQVWSSNSRYGYELSTHKTRPAADALRIDVAAVTSNH